MQGQKDPKEHAQEQSTTNAEKAETQAMPEEKSLNRRTAFRGGLLGIASVIVAACSGTDFASSSLDRKKGKKADGNDGGFDSGGQDGIDSDAGSDTDAGLGDIDGDDSGTGGNKTDIDRCAATTAQKVDTTGMPGIDEAPVVKIYGKRKSRMVAIQFSATTTFDQLLVATASGRVLALHIPTGADKNASGWRPIVIDPLDFDEGGAESAEVVLVIQQGSTRKQHRESLATFSTFRNLPVVDLTAATATSGWDVTKQSVARFKENKGTYQIDSSPSLTYPPPAGSNVFRRLKTAKTESTLEVSTSALATGQLAIPRVTDVPANFSSLTQLQQKNFLNSHGYVTDIMGVEMSFTELQGNGIQEFMLFCCYRADNPIQPTKYYRTMIFIA